METLGMAVVFILLFLIGYWFVTKVGDFLDGGGIRFEDGPDEAGIGIEDKDF